MKFYFDLVKSWLTKYAFLLILLLVNTVTLSIIAYHVFWQDISLRNYQSNNIISDSEEDSTNITSEEIKKEVEETPNNHVKYYIDIKGAVKKPGVYEVESTSIVNDCIKLAGGLLKTSDTNTINLSKKVFQEMVIYVPNKEEVEKAKTGNSNLENDTKKETILNDASITEENNASKKEESNQTSSLKVNLNTATMEELTKLSGIGEAKANDIITYRKTNGDFKTIDEIKNISGIGDALFAKIKDNITV